VIDSQQAVDIVKKYYPSCSPAEATEALSRAAMMKQTTDNLCVMVMFLSSPPEIQLPLVLTPRKKRLLKNIDTIPFNQDNNELLISSFRDNSIDVKNENYPMKENIIISPTLRLNNNSTLSSPPSNPSSNSSPNSPRSVPKKSPLLSPQNNNVSVIMPLKSSPTNFSNAPRTSPTHLDYLPLPSPRRKPIDR